jgi:dTDP-4-amino-4,6-dideoxygalactose transaminase
VPLRRVAPAGAPIGIAALASWIASLPRAGGAADALARAVCARQGVTTCVPCVTGRAALVLILRALASVTPAHRRHVIIPSYTCYTVAASVVQAGLSPRIVDVSLDTLDFERRELERVDFQDVLAIVPTNLYGLPSDLPYLDALATDRGVHLVDDAAQAMGASIASRPSGTWGSAGLYSLDKGKNITTIDGGLAVTSTASVGAALEQQARALPRRSAAAVGKDAGKLVAYALLLRPWLYWLPTLLPGMSLGTTHFPQHIELEQYAGVLASMGLTMLPELDAVNRRRRSTAAALDEATVDAPGITRVQPHPDAYSVYLRYPLLAASRSHRDALLAAFIARGIIASGSYPRALVDVPELAGYVDPRHPCPNGRAVADRILTLPTHPYVATTDIVAMREVLHDVRPPEGTGRER